MIAAREEKVELDQDCARRIFKSSIELKRKILEGGYLDILSLMVKKTVESLTLGNKIMLCGNGGSAADAQHLAAEFLIRLRSQINREAIPAIALAADSSTMTACGNDFGFEGLYERLVKGLGRPGDILLAITTSGRSPNILRALQAARASGIITLGFLGGNGGEALSLCDFAFVVPSVETGRIQEAHITVGHAFVEMIEDQMLANGHLSLMD
jgi:D-sedoheptulose 7-phosphate isomerase